MVHVSVIGCGNMGGAFLAGLARAGGHTVTACDVDPAALEAVSGYCSTTTTDLSVAAEADVVVVAVKPDLVGDVLDGLEISADQVLVSVAAGVPTTLLEEKTDATVVRIMPNLAARTGNMAAAVTGAELDDDVRTLLDDVGLYVEVEEDRMDVATAVNGSGPAFVFYLVNAMKRAGIDGGLTAAEAELLAAQTFKGAAETVLRSEESLDDLIDAVCSPNGTTIEGMKVLRDSNVEDVLIEAVHAAEERSRELSQEVEHA